MNKILKCYKDTTSMVNFDIHAGANISALMPIGELAKTVEKNIQNGGVGCCIHSSLILAKKLKEEGISSSFIYTAEPYEFGGKEVMGTRVSVLYYDDEAKEYFVANPVEDVELFTMLGLDSSLRYDKYNSDGTVRLPKSIMGTIVSEDASRIPVADFIERYGNGEAYVSYDVMGNEDKQFGELFINRAYLTTEDFKVEEKVATI